MIIKSFSPETFSELEEAWHILEKGEEMTAFQLYDWYKNLNNMYFREHLKHLAVEYTYVLVMDDDGNPLMIAPIEVIKVNIYYKKAGFKKGFYFIGREGYTDYLNFIYDSFSEEALNAILDYLKKTYHSNYFRLEQILERTSLCSYLLSHFQCVKEEMYCAALKLPESFDEYKALLSKNTRQNIRTAFNRQAKDGIDLTHEITFDINQDLQRKLMEVREERLEKKRQESKHKTRFAVRVYYKLLGAFNALFSTTQNVISENCNPWCFLVKNGDEIAGFFWGIRHIEKKEYYVILAGVEEKYAWYSPSVSHLYKYIEELYESGNQKDTVRVFDFTRGGESYKEKMGGVKESAWCLRFSCK